MQKKAIAEAKGIEAKAEAIEKQGMAEANVSREKYRSEAAGITEKAEAMKQLDAVGKDHEEFKLRLDKEKEVEIAAINAQRGIAESQAGVVGDALRSARIDIVGGDGEFFDQIKHNISRAAGTQAAENLHAAIRFRITEVRPIVDVR